MIEQGKTDPRFPTSNGKQGEVSLFSKQLHSTRIDNFAHDLNFEKVLYVIVDNCHSWIDDILIYSTTLNDHGFHVRTVLDILRAEKLFANLDKCKFCCDKLIFLGFMISSQGIHVDEDKS